MENMQMEALIMQGNELLRNIKFKTIVRDDNFIAVQI